jgi:hypothetical protein
MTPVDMDALPAAALPSVPACDVAGNVADRPTQFRTRIKGLGWGGWRKPGIDGWRAEAAEREFIKRDTLSGLCIEYASGQRVTHFLAPDDADTPTARPEESK